ncbi:hypothetical protein [Marinobacter sp. CHS3-4]|uniref:hypothetical protein n=1 Tax=Marinobacter sp. CHS3-4 TaxID=3045174 RepID=UPI0024B4A80A|nr:hypothetical protein [Marinobacter sp. CHS3-4]MDI9245143.1 hypothetical protein [Marinobacter sp. CHS3-4]
MSKNNRNNTHRFSALMFPNRIFRLFTILITLSSVSVLSGCNDGDNNYYGTTADGDGGETDAARLDTDGDGLTDLEEAAAGTSKRLADTDGDGFSDFQEVIEFGFNPDNNNFRFNPLIADVVKLGIEVTSAPDLSIDYQLESGSTETISVTREQSRATAQTVSNTSSNSRAVEETHTAGVEYSSTISASTLEIGGSATASASYDYSNATTNESSVSYTQEQSTENTETLGLAEAFESSNEYTETGGTLALILKVRNDSDLSFQVKSIRLGAVTLDSEDRRALKPVGNLDIDTSLVGFSSFTLPPQTTTDNLTFSTSLQLDAIKGLLRDPRGLIVRVASSEIVDSNGVAYAFRDTEIRTKTATVLIDYAGLKRSEGYLVATNVNQQTGRVAVSDVLADILNIPYTLTSDGQLASVRSLQATPTAYWVAVHVRDTGFGSPVVTVFNSTALNAEAFSELELKSGDSLALNFMEDLDGDGVGLRSERLFGSDPNDEDTDDDNLPDGVELQGFDLEILTADGGTISRRVRPSPIAADIDGDELTDSQECDMSSLLCSSDPNSADTDGDRIPDGFDLQPAAYTSLELTNFSASATSNTPRLEFELPTLDDLTYTVTRESVGLTGELTLCTKGEDLCPSVVIADQVSPADSSPIIITDTDGGDPDRQFHYQVYLSVNGSPDILVKEQGLNTIVKQIEMTVTLSSLEEIICWDEIPLLDSSVDDGTARDETCELFGYLSVSLVPDGDGPVIATERGGVQFIETGDNPQDFEFAEKTFSVPDVPGTCIFVKPRLWEKEDNKVDSNTDDDRLYNANLSYVSYKSAATMHCQVDGWNTGQHKVGMKYQQVQDQFTAFLPNLFDITFLVEQDSETYNGLSENLELKVVYDVTVTP